MRLTRDEIVLVVIVLMACVVGAAARHYRSAHPRVKSVAEPAASAVARSAGTVRAK